MDCIISKDGSSYAAKGRTIAEFSIESSLVLSMDWLGGASNVAEMRLGITGVSLKVEISKVERMDRRLLSCLKGKFSS